VINRRIAVSQAQTFAMSAYDPAAGNTLASFAQAGCNFRRPRISR
jgi:hypothetical protein